MTSAETQVADQETRADADALVLWQVAARADALLEAVAVNRPHQVALQSLLGYLRNVVLTRIAEEDTVLLQAYRTCTSTWSSTSQHIEADDLQRARQEHLLLRMDIEDLAEAADVAGTTQRQTLSDVVARLVTHLEAHLRSELSTLTEAGAGTVGLTWRSVLDWYPLAEHRVLDLSTIAPAAARHAALSTLATMPFGERLEVRGDENLEWLGHWLQRVYRGNVRWSTSRENGHTQLFLTPVAA